MPNQVTVTVSDADIAEYRERGYWISPKIFDDALIATLRTEFARIVAGDRDGAMDYWFNRPSWKEGDKALRQICNGWWVNNAVREAIASPVIGYIGSRLMGTDEVRVWHDQVLWKPGVGADGASEKSGNVGWHQDYAHWQIADTDNFCTAWVALQDTDLTNGGMRTIVGSHKWGLAADAYTFGEKDLDGLKTKYAKEGVPWIDEPCILKAGHASFHHSLTFHGSGPNLSNEPGLALVVHMMPKGCGFKSRAKPWHPNGILLGPDVKEGDPFAGPYFPQIWPPAR